MRMMQRKISQDGWQTLVELLPQLNAYHDGVRLDVLSKIDRVLVIERLTWEDLAGMIPEPSWFCDDVLEAITVIEKHGNHADVTAAQDFLERCKERAVHYPRVRLSPRQSAWLSGLLEKARENQAAFMRKQGCEPLPPPKKKGRRKKTEASASNVVPFAMGGRA
jgi:hypothetical protein